MISLALILEVEAGFPILFEYSCLKLRLFPRRDCLFVTFPGSSGDFFAATTYWDMQAVSRTCLKKYNTDLITDLDSALVRFVAILQKSALVGGIRLQLAIVNDRDLFLRDEESMLNLDAKATAILNPKADRSMEDIHFVACATVRKRTRILPPRLIKFHVFTLRDVVVGRQSIPFTMHTFSITVCHLH